MIQAYLAQFISIFTQLLILAIFVRVLLSLFRITPRGAFFTLIVESTEPILRFFRRRIPPIGGSLDLSPLFAYLALDIVRSLLLRILL